MKYIAPDKILYHPERLSKWMNEEQVKPITAEIHLSNRCNNACTYCGQKQNQNNTDMSIENIKLLRKFIDYTGIKSCYFSGGGESTLNPDLFIALYELHGIEMGMITNAVHMPDKLIEKYVQDFRWVRISVDAADDETYYKIRGTHSFKKVCKNIQDLLLSKKYCNSNTTVGLQIVVNEHNYDQIFYITGKLLDLFPDIDYVNIRPIEARINETVYSQHQLNEIFNGIHSITMISDKIIISEKWQEIFANKKDFGFKTCNASEFILTIDAFGNIYPCCHVINKVEYMIDKLPGDSYFQNRNTMPDILPNKGFNPKICPLGCRGSGINRTLYKMMDEKHRNFL